MDKTRPRRSPAGRRGLLAQDAARERRAPRLVGADRPPSRSTRTRSSARSPSGVSAAERAGLRQDDRARPAVRDPATTDRRAPRTGISDPLLPEPVAPPAPPTRVVRCPTATPTEPTASPRRRPAAGSSPSRPRRRSDAPRRAATAGSTRRRRPDDPDRRGRGPTPGRAARADRGPPTRGHRPDPGGQGARRPQGERRVHGGARGTVVPRGPGPGARGALARRGRRRGAVRRRRGGPRVARHGRDRRR